MQRGDALALLLKRVMITGATMALRRQVLLDALPLPESGWVHDAWIGTLAATRGQVSTLPEALVDYRLHSNNQLGLGGNDPLPRHERRMRQLEVERIQCDQLLERARYLGIAEHVLNLFQQKRSHVMSRAALGPHRLRRIPTVFAEVVAGNYQRYGRGLLSAGIDLIRR